MDSYKLFKPTIFIGIDQTGAVLTNGKPKPLPCSVIRKNSSGFDALVNLFQPDFCLTSICKLINTNEIQKAFILVDSVLGVPARNTTNMRLKKLFRNALMYSYDGNQYGAKTAHQFFNTVVRTNKTNLIPTREAERRAKANSIFNMKPFQRNIGCGTFRIWKELGYDLGWYSLWPTEQYTAHTCTIAEGYPSYLWKTFIGAKRGDHQALKDCAKKYNCNIRFNGNSKRFLSVDHMDSFVLSLYAAVGTQVLINTNSLPSSIKKEGWIFGL